MSQNIKPKNEGLNPCLLIPPSAHKCIVWLIVWLIIAEVMSVLVCFVFLQLLNEMIMRK